VTAAREGLANPLSQRLLPALFTGKINGAARRVRACVLHRDAFKEELIYQSNQRSPVNPERDNSPIGAEHRVDAETKPLVANPEAQNFANEVAEIVVRALPSMDAIRATTTRRLHNKGGLRQERKQRHRDANQLRRAGGLEKVRRSALLVLEGLPEGPMQHQCPFPRVLEAKLCILKLLVNHGVVSGVPGRPARDTTTSGERGEGKNEPNHTMV
jgi:hypothetical protein